MTSQNTSLSTIVRLIDLISEWSGRAISWLTLAMVLTTFTIVVMRYLFNIGNVALQESIIYMHSFVFLLGAAYTLKHDGHVRVDIFYRPMGEKGKAIINLFGTTCLLLPVAGFIFYISWEYVAIAWELKEGSQEAGGLPFRYILKSTLLLMPAMIILQGIGEILRSILVLTNQGHLLQEEEGHAL